MYVFIWSFTDSSCNCPLATTRRIATFRAAGRGGGWSGGGGGDRVFSYTTGGPPAGKGAMGRVRKGGRIPAIFSLRGSPFQSARGAGG